MISKNNNLSSLPNSLASHAGIIIIITVMKGAIIIIVINIIMIVCVLFRTFDK